MLSVDVTIRPSAICSKKSLEIINIFHRPGYKVYIYSATLNPMHGNEFTFGQNRYIPESIIREEKLISWLYLLRSKKNQQSKIRYSILSVTKNTNDAKNLCRPKSMSYTV